MTLRIVVKIVDASIFDAHVSTEKEKKTITSL